MNITIEAGDVIEINEDSMWDGCLAKVEEVRTWGIIGSVIGPQGTYPIRISTVAITAVYRKVTSNESIVPKTEG